MKEHSLVDIVTSWNLNKSDATRRTGIDEVLQDNDYTMSQLVVGIGNRLQQPYKTEIDENQQSCVIRKHRVIGLYKRGRTQTHSFIHSTMRVSCVQI